MTVMPVQGKRDDRLARQIGRLRRAMNIANEQRKPNVALRLAREIARLEGWDMQLPPGRKPKVKEPKVPKQKSVKVTPTPQLTEAAPAPQVDWTALLKD